jgi:hypothetical protein
MGGRYREVSKHLIRKGTEPWEILYFKAYKSQLPVIEQALETAGLMLGSDKSRGCCLEMRWLCLKNPASNRGLP